MHLSAVGFDCLMKPQLLPWFAIHTLSGWEASYGFLFPQHILSSRFAVIHLASTPQRFSSSLSKQQPLRSIPKLPAFWAWDVKSNKLKCPHMCWLTLWHTSCHPTNQDKCWKYGVIYVNHCWSTKTKKSFKSKSFPIKNPPSNHGEIAPLASSVSCFRHHHCETSVAFRWDHNET